MATRMTNILDLLAVQVILEATASRRASAKVKTTIDLLPIMAEHRNMDSRVDIPRVDVKANMAVKVNKAANLVKITAASLAEPMELDLTAATRVNLREAMAVQAKVDMAAEMVARKDDMATNNIMAREVVLNTVRSQNMADKKEADHMGAADLQEDLRAVDMVANTEAVLQAGTAASPNTADNNSNKARVVTKDVPVNTIKIRILVTEEA